jgi:hypothetical protein
MRHRLFTLSAGVSLAVFLFAAFGAMTAIGNDHPDFNLRPCLILMAVAAAVLLTWVILWARRRNDREQQSHRIRAGLCLRCGYDRRATRLRCPECGAMPWNTS